MRFAPLTIDRLIGRNVLGAVIGVWVVLVGFDAFVALVQELEDIGRGSYTLGTALTYVALTLPRRCYDLFGVAAVIGSLLGLGSLAATAEITAMRAGGMSRLRICLAVVGSVAVLTLLVVVMGETIGPAGERRAQSVAAGAKSQNRIASGGGGLWAREGDVLINARSGQSRDGSLELQQLRIYEFTSAGQLQRISTAARGSHDGSSWQLHDVLRMRFLKDSVESRKLPTLRWASTLDPKLLNLGLVRERYLPVVDLMSGIDYQQRNALQTQAFRTALWARLFFPLNVLMLVVAAVPFAFGSLRTGGMGKRLLIGLLLVTGFFFGQRALVNVADVYSIDVRLANALPSLLVALLATWWFRKAV